MARKKDVDHRLRLLGAERGRLSLRSHGELRLAIGSASPYFLAQSSLSLQWLAELAAREPRLGVERFTADSFLDGATLDSGASLAGFDILAWSCCFEPEAVGIVSTLLAAGIPARRSNRRGRPFPLLVVGGPLAEINPLPLAEVVDVLCLGPAELLLPLLISTVGSSPDRGAALEELAAHDGFFVPEHHLGSDGRPRDRLWRVQRRGPAATADEIPASYLVTPHTEYADRGLVEISRGCPEHCRFCWISHADGRLVSHPAGLIAERLAQLRALSPRIGLVATAVGDHPRLAQILGSCLELEAEVSVSSLRIPAMVPEVLEPLRRLGARALTIAPEVGNERLRAMIGKRVSDSAILQGVDAAQRAGIHGLKLYFMLGLPGESDDDIQSIGSLVRSIASVTLGHARSRGRLRDLRVSVGMLVPKPYTPFHREQMLERREARRRLAILRSALKGVSNLRLETPSLNQTWWQGYLSRAGTDAIDLIEEVASGRSLSAVLRAHSERVASVIWSEHSGDVPWHLVSTRRAGSGEGGSCPARGSF